MQESALKTSTNSSSNGEFYRPQFEPIVDYLPDHLNNEDFVVTHFEISEDQAKMSNLRYYMNNQPGMAIDPGKYARIHQKVRNGTGDCRHILWMSDTPMEKRTNIRFIRNANGRVIMFGLGIGMCIPPLLKNPKVTEVLVVEINQKLIDLIAPHYKHPKLTVIQGDAFEYFPDKGDLWDTVYFDIWPEISTDFLAVMGKLTRKWHYRLNKSNPKRFIDCWSRDRIKDMKQQEYRNSRSYF